MKKIWICFFATLAYCTAIAGLLTLLLPREGFWHEFIFAQCIGFSIAIINSLALSRIPRGKLRYAALSVTLPISIVVGVAVAIKLTGAGDEVYPNAWQPLLIGLFFGIIASITFILFERIGQLNLEVKQRQLSQIESAKREMEAQLKMLQAQIEPHFLFNTLANVSSLIDNNPMLSKKLLERLNDWLRVALTRARSDHTTLGDELDMLENYLQILKIRFGERLRWTIDVPEDIRGLAFPPMLLQPLVENAVRHGIELKIGGGEILIQAVIKNTGLCIEVNDSGVGLPSNIDIDGTGLANVRARLTTLFGEAGKLTLENNATVGVTATLELPR
ncbi:Autolysin sensor kinase [Candidatus Nitrotoga sp. HW29]|uniref:sensor histidine kinase n=1 Tax=Candidatus Nitrotoga sp. HW29 TaxID=2886963 RepID=UPI001EF2D9AD|nr:histidine kinase [Candidatus Nitrotoga sp. HW29]CAH1905065.1 Autolysin sensor kinase [Candidatus Nitrotoga sp. HW29]